MKVSQLIERLKECKQDSPVYYLEIGCENLVDVVVKDDLDETKVYLMQMETLEILESNDEEE